MLQVFGAMAQAGGFKQSIKEHRDHHKKQGDQICNLAEGLDKDDPRPTYEHQQYPKMLYKPLREEKGWKVVLHAQEMKDAIEDGWREEPYPTIQVHIPDPAQREKNMQDMNDKLHSQMVIMQEQMDQMAKMIDPAKAQSAANGKAKKATE